MHSSYSVLARVLNIPFPLAQFDLIDAKELAPLAELNEPILKEAAA